MNRHVIDALFAPATDHGSFAEDIKHDHQVPAPDSFSLPEGRELDLIMAGDAIFTVRSHTGARYTYRVTQADPNPAWPNSKPVHFVKVLSGPDNNSDYTYLGMITDREPCVVRLTKGSAKSFADGPAHKGLEWLLRQLMSGTGNWRTRAQLFHEGRCCRCGRRLTTPESVERGLGPECASK